MLNFIILVPFYINLISPPMQKLVFCPMSIVPKWFSSSWRFLRISPSFFTTLAWICQDPKVDGISVTLSFCQIILKIYLGGLDGQINDPFIEGTLVFIIFSKGMLEG